MMAKRQAVYIGRDFILEPMFGDVAKTLSRSGVEVIRGSEGAPLDLRHAEVIVTTTRIPISATDLDAAPSVHGIVYPGIGVDGIDLSEATTRGILVAHGPTPETFISMAEANVMLISVLLLGLHSKERQLAAYLPRPAMPRATMVHGRTIGIVGFGRIGRAVAERLAGWGVRILACGRKPEGHSVPPGVHWVSLDVLLAESDVVTLQATLNHDSRNMISAPHLRAMKRTAFLINTARGALVDEEALCIALRDGWIAGAALDTFETEPLPADSPLRSMENVILTDHCVGHTRDALESIERTLVGNVTRMLAGLEPLYTRNPEVTSAWLARHAGPKEGPQQ